MAKPTISHKQKQTLALLWDALSKILEEPAVSMPQALRDQGNAAIASAFESSDEEILDVPEGGETCQFTINDDGSVFCNTHQRLSPGPAKYCPEGEA